MRRDFTPAELNRARQNRTKSATAPKITKVTVPGPKQGRKVRVVPIPVKVAVGATAGYHGYKYYQRRSMGRRTSLFTKTHRRLRGK